MKRTWIPVLLVASVDIAALADEVVVGGMRYNDVRVLGVEDDQILFHTPGGKDVRKPLTDVTGIVLKGQDEFNRAEDLLATGAFSQAARQYELAASRMSQAWQKELVKRRQAAVVKRQAEAAAAATKPVVATQPATAVEPTTQATQPETRPSATGPAPATRPEVPTRPASSTRPAATQGGAETKPDPPTQPTTAAADPPASPEAMVEILLAKPVNPKDNPRTWEKMTTLDRERAEKDYARAAEAWKSKSQFHGQEVSWRLQVAKLLPTADVSEYTLTASSKSGYVVTAALPLLAGDALRKLKKGDPIRVTGTIKEYHMEGGEDKSIFNVNAVSFGVLLENAAAEPVK